MLSMEMKVMMVISMMARKKLIMEITVSLTGFDNDGHKQLTTMATTMTATTMTATTMTATTMTPTNHDDQRHNLAKFVQRCCEFGDFLKVCR